ncbi:hypothetical protein IQ244_05565 [Nostoc sp. LEGE 06077]|nr:hypothetical protein [Nostoc sp. LEGE 06077]
MPVASQWNFNWRELWKKTDFEYQNIIKLSDNDTILGLIRYAVYLTDENIPYLLEVLHIESVPKDSRMVAPVGKWLLWYAVQTALNFCTFNQNDDALVYLDALDDAIPYYGDIIGM